MIVYSELDELLVSLLHANAKVLEIGGVPDGYLSAQNSIDITRTNVDWLDGLDCLADAQNLPFSNEEFDLVFMVAVDYYIPDLKKGISEIYRVLKPNGIYVNATYAKSNLENQKIRDVYAIHALTTDEYMTMYQNFGFKVGLKKIINNKPLSKIKSLIWFFFPRYVLLLRSEWRIFICQK